MDEELRKAAQDAVDRYRNRMVEHVDRLELSMRVLETELAKNANAAPQDQDAKDAADIFWDYEDGEYCVRSIQEICENACDRGAENGAVLRVNQAKSLPHIFLRLIVPENPDDSVDYITISESEAIATMQQEQKP